MPPRHDEHATGASRPKLIASPAARARLAKLLPSPQTPHGGAPSPSKPTPSETAAIVDAAASATETKRARAARNNAVHKILAERWPRLFSWAQPLAVGIHRQLLAALGDQVDRHELSCFLRMWTRREA